MVSKNDTNSELDRRIVADLRARAQSQQRSDPDFTSEYTKETKKTGRFTWIWIILIVLAIISLLCIFFI